MMVVGLDQIEKGQEKKFNYSASDIEVEENINIALGDNVEFESRRSSSRENIPKIIEETNSPY